MRRDTSNFSICRRLPEACLSTVFSSQVCPALEAALLGRVLNTLGLMIYDILWLFFLLRFCLLHLAWMTEFLLLQPSSPVSWGEFGGLLCCGWAHHTSLTTRSPTADHVKESESWNDWCTGRAESPKLKDGLSKRRQSGLWPGRAGPLVTSVKYRYWYINPMVLNRLNSWRA